MYHSVMSLFSKPMNRLEVPVAMKDRLLTLVTLTVAAGSVRVGAKPRIASLDSTTWQRHPDSLRPRTSDVVAEPASPPTLPPS
jgi:hypothetical protein